MKLILLVLVALFVQTYALNPITLYKAALSKYPLPTNMITAGSLSVLSDSISQKIERLNVEKQVSESKLTISKKSKHSFERSLAMFFYGFTISGGFVYLWFRFLNNLIPTSASSSIVQVAKKVAVNQIVMSPILNSMFFAWVIFTRTSTFHLPFQEKLDTLKQKLSQDLMGTIKRSYFYWTTVNMFNFSIVPVQLQLLYTNLGFVIWTIYLSMVGWRKVSSR